MILYVTFHYLENSGIPNRNVSPNIHFFKCVELFGYIPAMFLTVRGVDGLGEDFKLPTCQGFYNIFHPVSIQGKGSDYIFVALNPC